MADSPHPEELSGAAEHVTCFCCFLGLCPRSASAVGVDFGCWFFFFFEFGCNRNLSEISHEVSGCAK